MLKKKINAYYFTKLWKWVLQITLVINPISKIRPQGYWVRLSYEAKPMPNKDSHCASPHFFVLSALSPCNLHSKQNTNAECFAYKCNENVLISDTEVTLFTQTDDCYFQYLLDTYTVIFPSYLKGSQVNGCISNESK